MADQNVRPTIYICVNGLYKALSFVDRALPEGSRLHVGSYTTSDLVRKLTWLEKVNASQVDPIVNVTLQDDNIGWLPQVTTENAHILLRETHRLGWEGFEIRHWAVGDLDPEMAYLARASWDGGATPRSAYEDHFNHVYGTTAAESPCQVM